MNCQKVVIVICLLLFVQVSNADTIHFKNGDRLSGKIVNLIDGKLTFKSDIAGEVKIDITNIQTFSSDSPIQVHLKDGTVINQKISASEPNQFTIDTSQTLRGQTFQLDSISSINPPEKPKPKWTGNISAGLTSTHGNTQTDNTTASVEMSKRTENDRIRLNADYAKSQQKNDTTGKKDTTEDWWKSRAKYDYFFTKKMFGYLDGRYEKDAIAELKRRVIMGGGAGYQWIESDDMNFSTEGGLASLFEDFDNQTESNSELSLQLGYHFDKKLTKKIKFINDTTFYPSLDKFSDYYLTSTAELRANFTERFFTNFKTIFDYDVTPAAGRSSTDVKYIFGIGLGF